MTSDSDGKPADSGSENKQTDEPTSSAAAVELIPKPQLLAVTHGVAEEMVGLVQASPEVLDLAGKLGQRVWGSSDSHGYATGHGVAFQISAA